MVPKKIHVGTSGWMYDDWHGPFYPAGVKGTGCFTYYQSRFDVVEVNSTFYRTPSEKVIESWNRRVGPGFHLVVKGARLVTHFRRLHGFEASLEMFLERVLRLRALRVILWQLPPSLGKDLELLERFLENLPTSVRHAIEFRTL